MTSLISAPFTSEQVEALNRFQAEGGMHPFTCGGLHINGLSPVLDATHSGWICPDPDCDYTQDWAHEFMTDPSTWPQSFRADRLASLRAAGLVRTEVQFGVPDCTCVPWTRQDGQPRYCVPSDTVEQISGWEVGEGCPHHEETPDASQEDDKPAPCRACGEPWHKHHQCSTELRERYAAEIGKCRTLTPLALADAVLSVRDARVDELMTELHRAKATLARVRDLHAEWLSPGALPLGTSVARWWDKRLIELAAALDESSGSTTISAPVPEEDTAAIRARLESIKPRTVRRREDNPRTTQENPVTSNKCTCQGLPMREGQTCGGHQQKPADKEEKP